MVRVIAPHPTTESTEPLGFMTLRPEPASVPVARRWFRLLTQRLEFVRPKSEALLLLSELVTNAVTHGKAEGDWRVHVEWWREEQALRIAVHSPGEAVPLTAQFAGGEDESGRGLFLLDCLADSWSADASRYGGIKVTFVLKDALAAP